jgi:hypothetical protein
MTTRPSYQVYVSTQEKQKILEDFAKAGFTSISDYFRWLAGLPTRKEQREQVKQQAVLERKRKQATQILKKKRVSSSE